MTPRSAWARTFVLPAIVLDVPLLARLVRRLTPEPRVEILDLDGVPTELVLPGGDGRWPGLHFVNGAHPERRQEPIVRRVTARDSTRCRACRTRLGRRRRRPVRRHRALGLPRDDIMLRASRHGSALRGDPADAASGRSLVAALPTGDGRTTLLELLRAQGPDDPDAIRCLSAPGRELGPEAQSVVSLLLNDDNERFPNLYRQLATGIARRLRELSPGEHVPAVRARVEAIAPPDDPYFPLPEAEAVVALVPEARLTVTRVLDHTRPSLALARIGDFARLLTWVRRCLRAASA